MTRPPETVLVTGGTGFIGLNLIETLLADGRRVASFDARPPPERARACFTGHPGFLGWLEGDTRVAGTLKSALVESAADSMIHAAAITAGPSRERRDPDTIASVNLGGTVAAMVAAADAGLRRVVHLSTAAVFGKTADEIPVLDEDAPKRPTTLYGISKSAAEDAALRLGDLLGLPVRVVRLGWIFGRWEHDTGVRDTLSLIYQATQAALAGQPFHPAEDPPRDWTPAPAVAAAILRLLRADAPRHRLYNLGSGRRYRVADWSRAQAPMLRQPVSSGAASPAPEAHGPALMSGDRFAAEFGPVVTTSLDQDVEAYLAWLHSGDGKWKA